MGGEMVGLGPVLLCWLERMEGRARQRGGGQEGLELLTLKLNPP